MAKVKKKLSIKSTLKFELYGILIILLSWIALSEQGSVGRSLTYMFRFTIGETYWMIPVAFIYVGLFVMVKRAWPSEWSSRKLGVVLFICGWLVLNHMSMIHLLDPEQDYTAPSYIIGETWKSMTEGLLKDHIGGGMIGAFLYSALYFLFGNIGTRLLTYTLFIIAFILVSGISIVDILSRLRGNSSGHKWGLVEWFKKQFSLRINKNKENDSQPNKVVVVPTNHSNEIDNQVPSDNKMVKTPIFFKLLNPEKSTMQDDIEEIDSESIFTPRVQTLSPIIDQIPATSETDLVHLEPRNDQDEINVNETFHSDWAKQANSTFQLPQLDLLTKNKDGRAKGSLSDESSNRRKLEATLESFGIRAKVLDVVRGPAVTRYEIQPDIGVRVSKIVSLTDDIALALAAKDIRMEAPIPGKSAIGIEVPNSEVSMVTLREVMELDAFQNTPSKLTVALGKDISGTPIVGNLARMPHLLVAGATGSGKSVCINGIITSILFKARPNEVKFLMIDPKMVELNVYNGIPHLLAPVVTDPRRASLALKKVVVEMEKRYELFSKSGTRNIEGYNTLISDPNYSPPTSPLPFIVVIVDELADLMMVAAGDVEDSICRLAQMARAAGIHLIIATQRPSVDVITGVIKANIPSRIAFGVSSQVDSRTILDMVGAEKLLGRGDMLYLPVGASKPIRVQGAFLSDQEVEKVVHYVQNQEKAEYQEELVPQIEEQPDNVDSFEDELYDQAVQIVLEAKQASVSLLQRRMRIGYTRAARLIDSMEAKGIVGPYEGSKPREVLLSLEQYQMNRIG